MQSQHPCNQPYKEIEHYQCPTGPLIHPSYYYAFYKGNVSLASNTINYFHCFWTLHMIHIHLFLASFIFAFSSHFIDKHIFIIIFTEQFKSWLQTSCCLPLNIQHAFCKNAEAKNVITYIRVIPVSNIQFKWKISIVPKNVFLFSFFVYLELRFNQDRCIVFCFYFCLVSFNQLTLFFVFKTLT